MNKVFRTMWLRNRYYNFHYSENVLDINSSVFDRVQYYLIYGGKCSASLVNKSSKI